MFRPGLAELDQAVQFESGWSILEIVPTTSRLTTPRPPRSPSPPSDRTDRPAGRFGAKPAAVMRACPWARSPRPTPPAASAGRHAIACHRACLMGEGEKSLGGPARRDGGGRAVPGSSMNSTRTRLSRHRTGRVRGTGMTTVGGPRDRHRARREARGRGSSPACSTSRAPANNQRWSALAASPRDRRHSRSRHTPLFLRRPRRVHPRGDRPRHHYWLRMTRQPSTSRMPPRPPARPHHARRDRPNPVGIMGMMNTAFPWASPCPAALRPQAQGGRSRPPGPAGRSTPPAPPSTFPVYGPGEVAAPIT